MDILNEPYRLTRHPSGLLLPTGSIREISSAEPPPRETTRPTDWIQALSGILALIVAAAALAVSLDTLRDQQNINRDQIRLNQLNTLRNQQRYSSRVAWWWSTASSDLFVLQN